MRQGPLVKANIRAILNPSISGNILAAHAASLLLKVHEALLSNRGKIQRDL